MMLTAERALHWVQCLLLNTLPIMKDGFRWATCLIFDIPFKQ
jgi:hypothetical protein